MGMALNTRTRVVRVNTGTVAGTTSINAPSSSGVDMSQNGGYRGVRFIALLGALTGSQVTKLKVQGSPDGSDYTTLGGDLLGSSTVAMADADGTKMLVCDVYRPIHRYVRAVVVRGTANAVIDGVIAELYDPITEPTTDDTTVSASKVTVSPILGTA
jgi:hypothetical protein